MSKQRKKKEEPLKLAPGELEILELLWSEGPVTLPQTREWFQNRGRHLATTTLHTRLNRLVDKGIVARASENPTRYAAMVSRDQVSGRHLELLKELCTRNWLPLFAQLAENRDFTAEEIKTLERIIEKKRNSKEK